MKNLLFLVSFLLALLTEASKPPTCAFIENKGQIVNQINQSNNDVLFLYTGNGIKIQLRKTGYSYELFSPTKIKQTNSLPYQSNRLQDTADVHINYHRVDVDFFGAEATSEIISSVETKEYFNYFLSGNEIQHVHGYQKVLYKEVYKNTDIEFLLNPESPTPFKYNIILHAGADAAQVKLLIKGAEKTWLEDGQLLMQTSLGLIKEKIPSSYYLDQPSINQPVSFKLQNNVVSFSAIYDASREFLIDPSSNLIWSSYYGGTNYDYNTCTGIDAVGNVYMAGHTLSTANIASSGAYQSQISGNLDVYVVKFDQSGNRLWATYYGGQNFEQVFSMALDSTGNVYLCGDTASPNNITSSGAHQTVYGGGIDDAMLIKFSDTGNRLWATYLGGDEHDIAQAVTIDKSGNVIITGHTESIGDIATPGSYKTSYTFLRDVFIAKFNGLGVRLWSTYYGDSDIEEAYGIATDTLNDIYITGFTKSISGISTIGCHQFNLVGFADVFIAKFNGSGNNLLWGTYFGGNENGAEQGNVIRVNSEGIVFVAGLTTSSNNISSPNASQPVPGSLEEGFIASFNGSGVRQWSTYVGGNGTDYVNDMVIDYNLNLMVCGQTISTNSISSSGAYRSALFSTNNFDAFFARYSSGGRKKLGTYFGGEGSDNAKGITVNNNGKVYIVGETTSTVSISSAVCHQQNAGGLQDGFIAKFCTDIEPIVSPRNTTLCIGTNILNATAGFVTYLWSDGSFLNPLSTTNTTVQGTYKYWVDVSDGFGCNGISDTAYIYIGDCYVSIDEKKNDDYAVLYPVPANDIIYIELKDKFPNEILKLLTYNSAGEILSDFATKERSIKMDLNLPSGLYVLEIKSSSRFIYKKFIKQ